MRPLPPSFKALYRLVLRASYASVLRKAAARRSLCKLWRPVFDGAVHVIRDLQSSKLSSIERLRREKLLDTWQKRSMSLILLNLQTLISRSGSHPLVFIVICSIPWYPS